MIFSTTITVRMMAIVTVIIISHMEYDSLILKTHHALFVIIYWVSLLCLVFLLFIFIHRVEDIAYKTKTKIRIIIIIKGQILNPYGQPGFLLTYLSIIVKGMILGAIMISIATTIMTMMKDLIEGVGWPATLQGRRAAVWGVLASSSSSWVIIVAINFVITITFEGREMEVGKVKMAALAEI